MKTITDTLETVSTVLLEYGSACRTDLFKKSGRDINADMKCMHSALADSSPMSLAHLRSQLNLCERGGGHWDDLPHDVICLPEVKVINELEVMSTSKDSSDLHPRIDNWVNEGGSIA